MCNPLKHKHTTSEHFTKPQFLARIAHMEYVSPKPLNSWFDFEAELQKINGLREERKSQHKPDFDEPIYRGIGSSGWKLETTLERSFPSERCDETTSLRRYYRKIAASKPTVETLTQRNWDQVPDFPEFDRELHEHQGYWLDTFLNQHTAVYEYLIYLRHHGFPSPLLDWTASPYVAAFFAFDTMDKHATHVSVYALLRGSTIGSGSAHLFIVGPYVKCDPRHYAQQSRYSLCVRLGNDDYHFKPHEECRPEETYGLRGELLKFDIPASDRVPALKHLDLMNINPFSIYGSEDSLVRTVARRELLFKPWNL
jgi:hypothetical protein